MNKYNILCSICARGGSKGVKNKNIRLINNKPLIAYTIEHAIQSNLFEHIVVSTDSDAIAEVARDYGADVFFKRSKELSSDTAGKLDVVKDAFLRSEKHYQKHFDFHIDLDATSPLRLPIDICQAFEQFLQHGNDNLITAMPSRRSPYFNMVEQDEHGKIHLCKSITGNVARRQDAPKTYDMNASIYVWKRDVLLHNDTIFLENTGLYIMPEERSYDIDSELDFKIVECLLKDIHAKR